MYVDGYFIVALLPVSERSVCENMAENLRPKRQQTSLLLAPILEEEPTPISTAHQPSRTHFQPRIQSSQPRKRSVPSHNSPAFVPRLHLFPRQFPPPNQIIEIYSTPPPPPPPPGAMSVNAFRLDPLAREWKPNTRIQESANQIAAIQENMAQHFSGDGQSISQQVVIANVEESNNSHIDSSSAKGDSCEVHKTETKVVESKAKPLPQSEDDQSSQQEMNKKATFADIQLEKLLHPTHDRWTLFYCKANRNKRWEDCMYLVSDVTTVEEFFALYNHTNEPSVLSVGSDYFFFKTGIKPMWEAQENKDGGRWLIMIDRGDKDKTDEFWFELLLALIGHQFSVDSSEICGAVINIRQKGDKISLWTRDATNDDSIRRIGMIMKTKLLIADQIRYEVHQACASKNSSMVKPKMIL